MAGSKSGPSILSPFERRLFETRRLFGKSSRLQCKRSISAERLG